MGQWPGLGQLGHPECPEGQDQLWCQPLPEEQLQL